MAEALNYKLLSPWQDTATSFDVIESATLFKTGRDECSNNPGIACPFASIRESIEGDGTTHIYNADEIKEMGNGLPGIKVTAKKLRIGLRVVDAIVFACNIEESDVLRGIEPKYGFLSNAVVRNNGKIVFVQIPQEETQSNPILQRAGSIFAFARFSSR